MPNVTKVITLRISTEEHELLRKLAFRRMQSMNKMIRVELGMDPLPGGEIEQTDLYRQVHREPSPQTSEAGS